MSVCICIMFTCIHVCVSLACVFCARACVYYFVCVCACIEGKARECASYSFVGLLLITNGSRSAFPGGIERRYCENRIEWKLEIRASYHNRFVHEILDINVM